MEWQEGIELNPNILAGKPVVKGTRLAVEFIVDLLAQGWSEEAILNNYPGLTPEGHVMRILARGIAGSATLGEQEITDERSQTGCEGS